MSLPQYYSTMQGLLEKYNACRPICTSTTCRGHRKELFADMFLASLSDDYAAAQSQIFTLSELSPIDEIYWRLNRL
jgi:hypothetical protein